MPEQDELRTSVRREAVVADRRDGSRSWNVTGVPRRDGRLSSDAKRNTPRRFDIGKVVQDLNGVRARSAPSLDVISAPLLSFITWVWWAVP